MKRVIAIYTRQSIDKKDSISIETQIEQCTNYINTYSNNSTDTGKPTIKVYSDRGYSGKNTKRPNFQKMLDDVKRDNLSKIVVYKLDRISRNLLDFTSMYQEFEAHRVQFCSVNETFDTSNAIGRAMLNIAMVFAQMERETIQLRVKDNYYQRIKTDGRWAGGPAPLGFRNGRTADNKPTLIVDEEEMKIIQYIFKNYSENYFSSLSMLCRELSKLGFRSRRENGKFDNVTLARALQSPVYCIADRTLYKYYESRKINFLNDEAAWNGTTSAHIVGKKAGNANVRKYTSLNEQSIYLTNFSGVIDSRTFIMVQDKLSRNEQIKKDTKPTHMKEFQGLLKCSKCGYAIKMYNVPKLSCYGHVQLKVCDAEYKHIEFESLRKQLGSLMMSNLDEVRRTIELQYLEQVSINNRIAVLKKEVDNLLELAAIGDETADIIYKKIEERRVKISEIEMEQSAAMSFTDKLGLECNISVDWKNLTDDEKKSICMAYIDKILLSEDGLLSIYWK